MEYILWCITVLHQSLDYNIRLRCATLIDILTGLKGYSVDYDIEKIKQVLMQDSRKSIRDILLKQNDKG